MYRILVADDETLERNAIRNVINSFCPEIGEVIEAANGLEALERTRIADPDIVILDIKMPGMNGIEAARAIRKESPERRIVFLTAHGEFEYAREAISLGAEEYLLKPADNAAIVNLVNSIVAQIETGRESRREEEERSRRLELLTGFFRNEYIAALLESGETPERMDSFHRMLLAEADECVVAATRMDFDRFPVSIHEDQRELLHRRVLSILREELESRLYTFLVHERGCLVYLVLFPGAERPGPYTSEPAIAELFSSVAQTVRERLSVSLLTAFTRCANDPHSLHSSLCRVRKANDETAANRASVAAEADASETEVPGEIRLVSAESGVNRVPGEIATFGSAHAAESGTLSPRLVTLLETVCEGIERDCSRPVTLEEAAAGVSLSSFYFSKVFKQYRGVTFIDWLNSVRVRKAKEMLGEPHESVKEIAASVGFADQNYFCRVFRNVSGETPSAYRNRVLTAKL